MTKPCEEPFQLGPRLQQQFRPGDLVAYWRAQKYQQGKVLLGGYWNLQLSLEALVRTTSLHTEDKFSEWPQNR